MKFYREKKSFIGKSYYLNSLSSIVYLINNSILMPAGTTKFFQYFQIFLLTKCKMEQIYFLKKCCFNLIIVKRRQRIQFLSV